MPFIYDPIVPATNDNDVQKAATQLNLAMEQVAENVTTIEGLINSLSNYLLKSEILQGFGQATDNTMSQKAITDFYNNITGMLGGIINDIQIITGNVTNITNSLANYVLISAIKQALDTSTPAASQVPSLRFFSNIVANIQQQIDDLAIPDASGIIVNNPIYVDDKFLLDNPYELDRGMYDQLMDAGFYQFNDMYFYKQMVVKQINPYSGKPMCHVFELYNYGTYGQFPPDMENPENNYNNFCPQIDSMGFNTDSPIWVGNIRDPYDTMWYRAIITPMTVNSSSLGSTYSWCILVFRAIGNMWQFYRVLQPSYCLNPRGSFDVDTIDRIIGTATPTFYRYRDVDSLARLNNDFYNPDSAQYTPPISDIPNNGITWDVEVYGVNQNMLYPTDNLQNILNYIGARNAFSYNTIFPSELW